QGSWPRAALPTLTAASCTITSPITNGYSCLAWAADNSGRWWWPDPMNVGYWPTGVTRAQTVGAFVAAYATLGYTICFDGTVDPTLEKIAIYGTGPAGSEVPTHAARQLASGDWTSKLGRLEDVTHLT